MLSYMKYCLSIFLVLISLTNLCTSHNVKQEYLIGTAVYYLDNDNKLNTYKDTKTKVSSIVLYGLAMDHLRYIRVDSSITNIVYYNCDSKFISDSRKIFEKNKILELTLDSCRSVDKVSINFLTITENLNVKNCKLDKMFFHRLKFPNLKRILLESILYEMLNLKPFNRTLEEVIICNSQLRDPLKGICELKNLKSLSMSHMRNLEVNNIHKSLDKFPNLEELIIDSCNLSTFPKFTKENYSIKKIDFMRNNLKFVESMDLDKVVNLESLIISYNRVSSFPLSLIKLKKLNRLQLQFNEVNEIGFDTLRKICEKFTLINLMNNPLDKVTQSYIEQLKKDSKCKVIF